MKNATITACVIAGVIGNAGIPLAGAQTDTQSQAVTVVQTTAPPSRPSGYPSKNVVLMAGPIRSASDGLARMIAPQLREKVGRAVIVWNNNNTNNITVASADPEGNVLLVLPALNVAQLKNLASLGRGVYASRTIRDDVGRFLSSTIAALNLPPLDPIAAPAPSDFADVAPLVTSASPKANASPELKVSQKVWGEFSNAEKATILSKFPQLEIISPETVGVIQSVQAVNRSSPGTTSGAALGSVLGQTRYIDNTLKGDGSNYSATTQVGAALLGAAIGSTLDSAPQMRYVFNYAVKTLDGAIREVRVESGDEFTRPVGQCVFFPKMAVAPASHCNTDKIQFLKTLSALSQASNEGIISQEVTGVNVNCRVLGVGVIRLERNGCLQMDGVIEK